MLLVLLMAALVGCSSNSDIDNNNINLDKTMTELGVPLEELKSDISTFILETYMPVKDKTKDDYIQSIMKYLSKSEYNKLIGDIGEYNPSVKSTVSNIVIKYGLKENSSDNCDKIMCSFDLTRDMDGVTLRNQVVIVFSIHAEQIDHHAVYFGDTQHKIGVGI